jgi:hypothetical protein
MHLVHLKVSRLNAVAEQLTVLLHVQKVPGLILSPKGGYYDLKLYWLLQYLQASAVIIP